MPSAKSLYESALGRLGLNFPDGLAGQANDVGVLSALNAALAEVAVDHDWLYGYTEDEFDLVTGVDTYTPTDTWLRTSFIVLVEDGTQLMPRQRRQHFMFGRSGANANRSRPRWFDTSGDRILIAPTPDKLYRVRHGYFTSFATIVRDSGTFENLYDQLDTVQIEIPDVYVPLAQLYISRAVALLIKDRELYDLVSTEIDRLRKKVEDNRRRHQGPGRISTRTDY